MKRWFTKSLGFMTVGGKFFPVGYGGRQEQVPRKR